MPCWIKVGWLDTDDDPSTPRQAWGIAKITQGTPFAVTYVTTGSAQRVQVSSIVAESLAQCGIQVTVEYLDQADLYAPGPQGSLFGRAFMLAEFAMGSTGIEPPCEWYISAEIPTAANLWIGTNVSGYGNPDFDSACSSSNQSLPDEASPPGGIPSGPIIVRPGSARHPALLAYPHRRGAPRGMRLCSRCHRRGEPVEHRNDGDRHRLRAVKTPLGYYVKLPNPRVVSLDFLLFLC